MKDNKISPAGGGGGQIVRNGHGGHQTGSSEVLYQESYGSNSDHSDNVRSFYKSRVIEKLYSDGARASREESREVSCFVRSEIKWVFLKSLKVRQSVVSVLSWCIFRLSQTVSVEAQLQCVTLFHLIDPTIYTITQ